MIVEVTHMRMMEVSHMKLMEGYRMNCWEQSNWPMTRWVLSSLEQDHWEQSRLDLVQVPYMCWMFRWAWHKMRKESSMNSVVDSRFLRVLLVLLQEK